MKKLLTLVISTISALFLVATPAFAHVVVTPNTVETAAFQTFTIGVPNEKDNPTIAIKLVIPEGLNYVTPNVKPGWNIEIKKSGEGENAKVMEIDWTGGAIPKGQRDEFLFSAQVPAKETTIQWKAYQIYENGDVISWDHNPDAMRSLSDQQKEENEAKGIGPYSQTIVVDQLKEATASMKEETEASNFPLLLSGLAVILSAAAFYLQMKRK